MKKPKVLVTRRWPQNVQDRLTELFEPTFNDSDAPLSLDTFKRALANHDALLPTVTDSIGADVFDVSSVQAKIIANYGVGYSHIDVDIARSKGVVVTNTPDVLSECTADIALTLMLMVARRAGEGERELRAGGWTGWRPTHMVGRKVSGKKLGIVGYGRIGRETARRAHFGFGMKVIVQNRSAISDEALREFNATQVSSLDELLAVSDFVSLHCPGGAENRHLIDADRLSTMKSSAYLINTARGEVVDDEALAEALGHGTIAGVGLDVFYGEPNIYPALLDAPNTVLLPHLGSATSETREAMGMRVIDNLVAYFKGQEPPDRVA